MVSSNATTGTLELKLQRDNLEPVARAGGFYSYIAGTALAVLESPKFVSKFVSGRRGGREAAEGAKDGAELTMQHGLFIDNYLTTLPMKKGLSSSAAVCVLVASAFSAVYDLKFSHEELMELAYIGEMRTPSRCGRMDQCVVMGSHAIALMTFDGAHCSLRRLRCGANLYFVVVDLNASKDTVVILRDLNACFPAPADPTQVIK